MTAIPATEGTDAAQVGPPPPFDAELRPLLDAAAAAGRPVYTLEDIPLLRQAPPLIPVPTDEDLQDDNLMQASDFLGEPLPLFPGPEIVSHSGAFESGRGRYVMGNTSGLYSWPESLSEDCVLFVMPHPIGANGFIEDGNPDYVREGHRQNVPADLVNNDSLYQHGWCPFLPSHLPRLFTVLYSWTEMVRSGKWAVGGDGVEGGIEVFCEADTPEHALEYRLGACFDHE